MNEMLQDLIDFRNRERIGSFPTRHTVGVRVPVVMKQRLASKAIELGTSESALMRFLAYKALERYGVDAFEVL